VGRAEGVVPCPGSNRVTGLDESTVEVAARCVWGRIPNSSINVITLEDVNRPHDGETRLDDKRRRNELARNSARCSRLAP